MTRCTSKLAGFATAIVKPAGAEESAPTTERKTDVDQRNNGGVAGQARKVHEDEERDNAR